MEANIFFDPKSKQLKIVEINNEEFLPGEFLIMSGDHIMEYLPEYIKTIEMVKIIQNFVFDGCQKLNNYISGEVNKINFVEKKFNNKVQKFLLEPLKKFGPKLKNENVLIGRDFYFSRRTFSCLNAAGIEKIYDIAVNYNKLLRYRNFGKLSLKEVNDVFNFNEISVNVITILIDKDQELNSMFISSIPEIYECSYFDRLNELFFGFYDLSKFTIGEYLYLSYYKIFPNNESRTTAIEEKYILESERKEISNNMYFLEKVVLKYIDSEMEKFIKE